MVFIRLGGGIRDDMFWALHSKETPCLKHPVSLLRSTADLVFLVLGGAASTHKDKHMTVLAKEKIPSPWP